MSKNISEEWLSFFESLLRAQLNTIKQFRKSHGLKEEKEPQEKRMSQMDITYDILFEAQRPMHVNEIIRSAAQRFGTQLDRESLVSALTKRVKRQDRFIKTGPNTFSLLSLDVKGGRQ